MNSSFPKKKKPEEIVHDPLREMLLSRKEWEELEHGVELFNNHQFWHAHEAWEIVWKRHAEDERLFFQGLIQLAAAYHHLAMGKSYHGLVNNFSKARAKLEVFRPAYLGVKVEPLLRSIELGQNKAQELGEDHWKDFEPRLIPKIRFIRKF